MKLSHPDSKQKITVSDDEAGMYLSQGWVDTSAEKPPAK